MTVYDFFISHASEDKEDVARPLRNRLTEEGYRVWLDEHELTIGDSLRQTIDRGLRNSRFGIVILSNNFFAKSWPKDELDGLLALEHAEGIKRILPVWHEVDRDQVADFSPILAGRLAASTSAGIDAVLDRLQRASTQASAERPRASAPAQVAVNLDELDDVLEFLTEHCLDLLDARGLQRLGALVGELLVNAFEHGDAKSAVLTRFGKSVVFSDDGHPFDPSDQGETELGAGLRFFNKFVAEYDQIAYTFTPGRSYTTVQDGSDAQGLNEHRFIFEHGADHDYDCSIMLAPRAIVAYNEFMHHPGQFLDIPVDCERYELDLRKLNNIPLVVSGLVGICIEIMRRLDTGQDLRVIADDRMVYEVLISSLPSEPQLEVVLED